MRQSDLSKSFKLYTDATWIAVGAVLVQVDDEGAEYVVGYTSRVLKRAEKHYGIS